MQVGGHVAQLGQRLEQRDQARSPRVQFSQVRVLERVLKLRLTEASADLQFLARTQMQIDSGHAGDFIAQARQYLPRIGLTLTERLEIDDQAAVVPGGARTDPPV